MIRKKTAIFFLLLANSILLAHAVIPHHYHQAQVCIVNAHCQNDSKAHQHNAAGHNHEHDGSEGTQNCVLKQAVATPANSLRQEFKCLGCDDNHSPLIHLQAVLFSLEFNSFVPKIVSDAQTPLGSSLHSNFVSTSLGLRAPPHCLNLFS